MPDSYLDSYVDTKVDTPKVADSQSKKTNEEEQNTLAKVDAPAHEVSQPQQAVAPGTTALATQPTQESQPEKSSAAKPQQAVAPGTTEPTQETQPDKSWVTPHGPAKKNKYQDGTYWKPAESNYIRYAHTRYVSVCF